MAVRATRIYAITAKIESVEGTDSLPTLALDAVRPVGTPLLRVGYLEEGKRPDVIHAGLGSLGRVGPGGRYGEIDVTLEARGKGTAYTTVNDFVEAEPFFRAGGFVAAYAAGVKSFTTVDEATQTISMYLYAHGLRYILRGVRVRSIRVSLLPGRPAMLTFGCIGRLLETPAELAISGLVLNSVLPPIWRDQTVTVGAWSTSTATPNFLVPRSLEIEHTHSTPARPSAGLLNPNQAFGHAGYALVGRESRATMRVEPVALTTFDPYVAALEAAGAVSRKITTRLGPAGDGNTFGVFTGDWAIEGPDTSDEEGMGLVTLTGDLVARSLSPVNREVEYTYS